MSQPYIGEIRMVGFNFAPRGWAKCDGQTVTIVDNDALFSLIGTTYGGDGIATFVLPNLQSRFPIHRGTSVVAGSHAIGEQFGSEMVTLTTNQLPGHSHTANAVSGPAASTSTSPVNNRWAALIPNTNPPYEANGAAAMHASAMSQAGNSQPHENMPPFLTINFVIALEGLFPSPP